MGSWITDLITKAIDGVANAVTAWTMGQLNWVLGLLSDTIFTSPDVTALPQVHDMSQRALLSANACMALIVTVVGFLAMTHGSLQDRHSLKELLPRMLVGFLAANMSTVLVSTAITGANALTEALAGGGLTSQDSFNQIKRVIVGAAGSPAQFIVLVVLRELAGWLLILLVVTWLGRLSVLLVVAATAPIALLCHSLPQTDPIAKVWWRTLAGCLTIQILQAITLHMAVATLLTGGANLPALGLPHDPSGLLNLLIACYLLWLVIRIPKWVSQTFGGNAGRGGSMLASIVRVLVVQKLLGAVGLRGGGLKLGRRGAAAAAARSHRPRPPSQHYHQHANSHQHEHVHVHFPRDGGPGASRSEGPGRGSAGQGAAGRGSAGQGRGAQRPQYWAGDVTPPRPSRPGRPPLALEGGSPAVAGRPRPVIGPGPTR